MLTLPLRRFSLVSPRRPPLAGLALGLGLALASATAAHSGELAGLRVTGVVQVPGESDWAVIGLPSGETQIVRQGDQLPNIGTVSKILPTGIRLDTPKGSRLVNLEWGPAGATPPVAEAPAPVQPASHHLPAMIQATPEVMSAIGRVAATAGATSADLSRALIPLLELPGDASVSGFFPGQPERDAKGTAEIGASLARGEMVRLNVESGGQKQTVYVRPEQPAGVASAAPNARTK